jgi:iron complex outermembrane receptor protein
MFKPSFVVKPITVKPIVMSAMASVAITLPSAFADESKKLETVYVSATRSETVPVPVATQIKIISAEDISISGAKLLTDVLRTQAGMQLSDMDGSGMRSVSISMRGLSGANNVLVLVDGRKLNNPSQEGPALNAIALRDIERIEIVQGSAGVLYGDQAIGGVINVITRRAAAGETSGSLVARAGSDNLEDYGINLSQGFANGLSYSASGQKRNADNYRDNNQSAYESALINLRYDQERGFVFVEGQRVNDDLNIAGSISDAQALLDRKQTNTPDDYSNKQTETWRLGGGLDITSNWALQAEYSDRDEQGEYLYSPTVTQYSMQVKSVTPRIVGNYALANGPLVATLGYDDIDSRYESNNMWSPVASKQQQQSFYAQLLYPLLPKLTATMGARYSEVEDENQLLSLQQKDDLTASEFGLNYQASAQWRVFGRYAESFRFANPDDNNLLPANVVFLKPQTGESFELGAQWQGDAAQVSYSVYHMTLNDEIVYDPFVPNNQFYNGANINLPDSERQGFILDTDTRLSAELGLRFNYTYTDAEVIDGAYEGKKVPFIAKNAASATILFTPVKPLTFSLEAVYTGSRYKSGDEDNLSPILDALTVFNLAGIYTYRQLEISGRINNITNEIYAGYHSVWGQYPQPERNYEASIAYRF